MRILPKCGLGIISITILVIAVLYHTLSLGNKATPSSETHKEELINKRSNVIRVIIHAEAKSPSHKEITTNIHIHILLIKPTVNIVLKGI